MVAYDGSCHCGAIGYRFRSASAAATWPMRACQCRFCRAHDVVSTSDPDGDLELFATDRRHLQRYRFALRTADFLVCSHCGVYIGAVIESGDGRFGIINVRALEAPPKRLAPATAASYDAEDTQGRIARRERRWTPVSRVPW